MDTAQSRFGVVEGNPTAFVFDEVVGEHGVEPVFLLLLSKHG
jgi:hypothetical protein